MHSAFTGLWFWSLPTDDELMADEYRVGASEVFRRRWFSNIARGSQGTTLRVRITSGDSCNLEYCEIRDARCFWLTCSGVIYSPKSVTVSWWPCWLPPHHELSIPESERAAIRSRIRDALKSLGWSAKGFGLDDGESYRMDRLQDGFILTRDFARKVIDVRIASSESIIASSQHSVKYCSVPICLDPERSLLHPNRWLLFSRAPLVWRGETQETVTPADHEQIMQAIRADLNWTSQRLGWEIVEVDLDYLNRCGC